MNNSNDNEELEATRIALNEAERAYVNERRRLAEVTEAFNECPVEHNAKLVIVSERLLAHHRDVRERAWETFFRLLDAQEAGSQ